MSKIVEVNNLVKKFGSKTVLRDITLNLEKGKILGILGPNGQGKTTLLNILAGLQKPTSGEVKVDEILVGYESKKIVSYLQEKDYLYKWMTIEDSVNFHKDFFRDFDEVKINKLLEFMKLDKKSKVKNLN